MDKGDIFLLALGLISLLGFLNWLRINRKSKASITTEEKLQEDNITTELNDWNAHNKLPPTCSSFYEFYVKHVKPVDRWEKEGDVQSVWIVDSDNSLYEGSDQMAKAYRHHFSLTFVKARAFEEISAGILDGDEARWCIKSLHKAEMKSYPILEKLHRIQEVYKNIRS